MAGLWTGRHDNNKTHRDTGYTTQSLTHAPTDAQLSKREKEARATVRHNSRTDNDTFRVVSVCGPHTGAFLLTAHTPYTHA